MYGSGRTPVNLIFRAHMPASLLLVAILAAAFGGAALIGVLSADGLRVFVAIDMVVCIGLGWVVIFQNEGVAFRGGLSGFFLGHLQPVPRAWLRPVAFSMAMQTLLVAASAMLGAVARMLWLAHA
jgi:hypothetical protein